jgi:hypothetical protein
MSVAPRLRKRKPPKPDESIEDFVDDECEPDRSAPSKPSDPTKRRRKAAFRQQLTQLRLKKQLDRLTARVALLERLIDPEDIAAYHELKVISPRYDEIDDLTRDSGPPPFFVEEPDE